MVEFQMNSVQIEEAMALIFVPPVETQELL
jgi:hypothetical protein